MRDRETNKVVARRMEGTDASALQTFVREHVQPGATLYTDEAKAYAGMPEFDHEAVKQSAKEFVRGMASTNGMESFWAMLKRGYVGTFHKFSEKHLDRYVVEVSGRHNIRPQDTIDMMIHLASGMRGKRLRYRDRPWHGRDGARHRCGMRGKRLRYRDLIADNGLPSGARAVA